MYKVKVTKGKFINRVGIILAKYTIKVEGINTSILIVELDSTKERIEVPEDDTESI